MAGARRLQARIMGNNPRERLLNMPTSRYAAASFASNFTFQISRGADKAMPFFKFFGLGCLYPALFERAWTEARRHPGQGVFQGSLRGRSEFKTGLNAAVRFCQWAAFGAPAHPCGVSLQCAGQGLGGGRFSGFGARLHPFCFSPPEAHLTDVRPGAGGPECAGMRRRGAGGGDCL